MGIASFDIEQAPSALLAGERDLEFTERRALYHSTEDSEPGPGDLKKTHPYFQPTFSLLHRNINFPRGSKN